MEYTSTRQGIGAAFQKASDAYALARRLEERLRGAEERIAGLEAELEARMADIERALARPVEPARQTRRKAA